MYTSLYALPISIVFDLAVFETGDTRIAEGGPLDSPELEATYLMVVAPVAAHGQVYLLVPPETILSGTLVLHCRDSIVQSR